MARFQAAPLQPVKRELDAAGGVDHFARESRMRRAAYIAELGAQLAALAREADLDLVAYLLDMSVIEARSSALQSQDR